MTNTTINKANHFSTKGEEAEVKLQQLISLTKDMKLDASDLNGDEAKQAYLNERYVLVNADN